MVERNRNVGPVAVKRRVGHVLAGRSDHFFIQIVSDIPVIAVKHMQRLDKIPAGTAEIQDPFHRLKDLVHEKHFVEQRFAHPAKIPRQVTDRSFFFGLRHQHSPLPASAVPLSGQRLSDISPDNSHVSNDTFSHSFL